MSRATDLETYQQMSRVGDTVEVHYLERGHTGAVNDLWVPARVLAVHPGARITVECLRGKFPEGAGKKVLRWWGHDPGWRRVATPGQGALKPHTVSE